MSTIVVRISRTPSVSSIVRSRWSVMSRRYGTSGGRHEIGVIGEPVDQLPRRDRMPAELHGVAPEPEDLDLQRCSCRGLRVGPEDDVLELVRAILQLLDHLEVVVHDLVGDRVQSRPRAGGERAHDRPPLLRLRRGRRPERTAASRGTEARRRRRARIRRGRPSRGSGDGTPRRRAPDRGRAWVAGSGGGRPRREVVEIQLPLELPDVLLVRIDDVDPDPRTPRRERLHGAPEIAHGHGVGMDDPLADDDAPPSPGA